MAQKRDKEETELKVPETLTLCSPSIAGAATGATAGANGGVSVGATAGATSSISGSDDCRSSPLSPDRSDLGLDVKADLAVDSRSRSASSPSPDLHRKPRSPAEASNGDSNNPSGDSYDLNGNFNDLNGDLSNRNGDSNGGDLSTRNGDLSNQNGDLSNRNGASNELKDLSYRSGVLSDRNGDSRRRVINRCSGCRRKVGLMGFRCRCGETFCSDHRYSDRHDCSYDYKAAGREAIARENPVVRPAKILKV